MRRKKVVLWDIDIVWAEELKKYLSEKDIFCEEADNREELHEIVKRKDSPLLCILSEETLEELYSTVEEAIESISEITDLPLVIVLPDDDTAVELAALKKGAAEVLFKKKGVEIAVERILLLLRKELFLERAGRMPEGKNIPFEEVFSGIYFTDLEKNVLYEMYRKEGQLIGRKELIEKVWKERKADDRAVDTVVKQLRKKMGNTSYRIQGVYGKGYLLKQTET